MSLILRSDLEPWDCDDCKALVYGGEVLNRKFYCFRCAPAIELGLETLVDESEEAEDESPEVNLEDVV